MKHIAKAKLRSWYDKGIKMIFAKILYPDFFAAAMVFHLVKLSICWNENHENVEQVRPVGSWGGGDEVLWTKNWFGICFEWSWNKESSFLLLTYKLMRITTMLFADSFFRCPFSFTSPSPLRKIHLPLPYKKWTVPLLIEVKEWMDNFI